MKTKPVEQTPIRKTSDKAPWPAGAKECERCLGVGHKGKDTYHCHKCRGKGYTLAGKPGAAWRRNFVINPELGHSWNRK